jgi:HEAT repeat protein
VLQLIDEAPVSQAELDSDPDVLRLRAEALAGISDRDVVATLVLLVGLDTRDAQFASTMSSLEDLLDILVAKGQIEVAAEAALSLLDAAKNPKLDADQKRRLEDAVRRFARPDDIRAIVKAMRQSKPGEPEHDAARRLLDSLGAVAYPPLLEQLAEEPDRMERKSLIDLLSRDAVKYIPELGEQVSDPRWFFVRNVIGILASTKSSAILPYLERTLRQPDARVRRETVRALSSVGDRRALEMLVQALTDDDAQNVQLAARYLGLRGTASAIPALEQVAKGEGRGNRENGPKIEAIEALGKLGAVQALPTLQALATKRSLIGSSRVREIKTAAAAAIAVISAKGGVS